MKFVRLLRAVLREIFDETAYERFCLSTQAERGRASYAEFLRESNAKKIGRIRCC